MAYFGGSAIYLRSTLKTQEITIRESGGIYLLNNTFSNNNALNGAAVSALC